MYFGTKPFLHITDLDMIRDVTARHFDKFVDHFVSKAIYILLFITFRVVAGSMCVCIACTSAYLFFHVSN